MAFYFNGTNLSAVRFNGVNVEKVYMNGVLVWSGHPAVTLGVSYMASVPGISQFYGYYSGRGGSINPSTVNGVGIEAIGAADNAQKTVIVNTFADINSLRVFYDNVWYTLQPLVGKRQWYITNNTLNSAIRGKLNSSMVLLLDIN